MQRVILDRFGFIPFTGIGFVIETTEHYQLGDMPTYKFRFCFPLMLEKWYAETNLSEKYTFLEPQAKFEMTMTYGRRKKWIETYYYATFLFKKEHEDKYDNWRRRFFPETYLYSLEKYDEVEVPVCIITVLYPKERSEENYSLLHDLKENFYVLTHDKNENLFIVPQTYGEKDIVDYIDEVVELKTAKLFKKKSTTKERRYIKQHKTKILHLNEKFQKVFDERLSKLKQEFRLN